MDPYLEGSLWSSVHGALAIEIIRQLNPKIRPQYMALTIRRHVLEVPEENDIAIEGIYPDVSVMRSDSPRAAAPAAGASPPALKLMTIVPESVPHISIEIREAHGRHLVTAIEILEIGCHANHHERRATRSSERCELPESPPAPPPLRHGLRPRRPGGRAC
jgi:hypothetical protein